MTTTIGNQYIMEDPREATRLSTKVDSDDFIQKYIQSCIHNSTQKILDVGCGPAAITGRLGELYPCISITGIDTSQDRVAHAKVRNLSCKNVHIHQADARALPFGDETFDIIYCRFLLEYIKESQKAFEEMYRVCKRGGTVILQDLDGQLISNYPLPSFNPELLKIVEYLATTGFDPFIGRKLYCMAYDTDFKIKEIKVEPYHLIFGKIDPHNYELWNLKLDIALPQITKALGSEEKSKAFKKQYLDYLSDERSMSISHLITVNCTRK